MESIDSTFINTSIFFFFTKERKNKITKGKRVIPRPALSNILQTDTLLFKGKKLF
ncbi:hypothetical protein JFPO13_contig00007-0048 [Edwardsiella piscicida]|nr:hypothetical protein JFPO13_contig00007-0048 [Edwardsiella piscicida]